MLYRRQRQKRQQKNKIKSGIRNKKRKASVLKNQRKSEERKCFNLSGSNGIGILETGGTVPKRTADFGRSFADGGSRRAVGYGAVGGCAAKLMLAKTN